MLGMESTTFQVKIHPLTNSYKVEPYDVYPLIQPNLPMHFGSNLNLIQEIKDTKEEWEL